jgi:hypothetical protein
MKLINFLMIGITASMFYSCSGDQNGKNDAEGKDTVKTTVDNTATAEGQRYGIKSGIVYYEPMEIMGIKTSQILYFDDYGKKESRETVTEGEIMGMKTKKRSISYTEGNYQVSFDLENITNNKDELQKIATRTDMSKNPFANMDLSTLTDAMKTEFDYKEEGTEMVAGVTGTKYSVKMSKESTQRITGVVYKNIPLKVDMGQIKMVAQKFEQDVNVPSTVFAVPEGYTIQDVDPFADIKKK